MGGTESGRRVWVLRALRSARGRYTAERASQLSGVPRSTLYDWQRNDVLVPDLAGASPMLWSYRDLVYARLLAWLRQRGMPRPSAAAYVGTVRRALASGEQFERVLTDGVVMLMEGETTPRHAGPLPLPVDDLVQFFGVFDLAEAVSELGGRHPWGPDLVTPSPRTAISPTVLAGEPCVQATRITTASLWALRVERGLDEGTILSLYPDLDAEAIKDAWGLEERLRRAA